MGAVYILILAAALAAAGGVEAALVEHTFVVSQMKMNHMCNDTLVTLVNGQLPGPAIEVTEGDSVVVHIINKSPLGLTIHWHGIRQQLNCWADGADMITQCHIQPNKNYTYRFNVIGQEGTLWWHAHVGCRRVTIHGALIIRPRSGPDAYPFPKPDEEIPIIIGEWWDIDVVEIERRYANNYYQSVPISVTFNGKIGELSNCSGVIEENYNLTVENGKTYLLRIVNAALRSEYYFKIAGHTFTVVAADANYVKPYTTDIIAIAPGETIDALLIADAPPGKYYMFALGIQSAEPNKQYPVMISRGIVYYNNSSKGYEVDTPAMAPEMPIYNDRSASLYFHGNLSSLPHRLLPSVPSSVNERMFITMDSGHICKEGWPSCNATVTRMNNISFQMPATTPLLLAHYNKNISSAISMVREFPSTSPKIEFNEGMTMKATSFTRVPYNTTVEIVFQGPPEGISYPNPMHLHGHEFFVLAQGLGQYEAEKDLHTYNLVDPPLKNTANVQRVGWTVIRFVANNPGVWFFHCHIESHAESGMAMAFVVEDGPTLSTTLPPPPADYKSCDDQSSKDDAYE